MISFKTNDISRNASIASKDKLIVFFLGGLTHSEIRVVKDIDNAAGWKDTIGICGGTSVITAEDFA